MLTWWLQADIHINEDDQFQQNLALTLQAMTMEKRENFIKIIVHKEIEDELNIIIPYQVGTWLEVGLKKLCIYTTGKGDIFFRLLCSTMANSFLLAEREAKRVKSQLEYGLYSQFGICISSSLVRLTVIGIEGFSTPTITPVSGKVMVLLVTTEENSLYEEIGGDFQTDYLFHLQNYSTAEVNNVMDNFYSETGGILTPPHSSDSLELETSFNEEDSALVSPLELLEMFDE